MLAKSEIQREALNLSAQERIELVVELWDSLAPGEIPVPDWQRGLIRDRLAALEDVLPEERSVALGSGPQASLLRHDLTLPVRLTSAAVQDLALAARWYLDEAPHVLASFEVEIDRAFRLISERPELYQTVVSTVRRALVRKFPFEDLPVP